jgi:hypothetical protein
MLTPKHLVSTVLRPFGFRGKTTRKDQTSFTLAVYLSRDIKYDVRPVATLITVKEIRETWLVTYSLLSERRWMWAIRGLIMNPCQLSS